MVVAEQLVLGTTLAAAVGCGLIGGVFFAFSTFIMKGLARLPGNEGMAAMQAINIAVINPVFLGSFLGTAVVSALAIVLSLLRWNDPGALLRITGGTLYVVGTFGVTMAFNVPRNDALALLTPADPNADPHWRQYIRTWTMWNHVRTAAGLVAAVLFSLALAA